MSTKDDIVTYARAQISRLRAGDRLRVLTPIQRGAAGQAVRASRALISFCDNDYLGLSQDPRVKEAASAAALEHGAGAGASRLVTGNHPLNMAVEQHLAAMKGTAAARIFGSGYLANIGTIPALVGRADRILLDELSHACMYSGARLSGSEVVRFAHNDLDDLGRHLRTSRPGQRQLVLTETVFSMDGDCAPLEEIAALCEAYGAWLMTDDAHGFGLLKGGNPAPIQMGTLSKSVGSYGGYVSGPIELIDLLANRARSFVYTTGLPPAVLAATLSALEIIQAEPERAERAMAHAALFCRRLGLSAPQSPIVPLIIGREDDALCISADLARNGFLVTPIRPPTVPEGTARLRFTFSAVHERHHIEALAGAVQSALETV